MSSGRIAERPLDQRAEKESNAGDRLLHIERRERRRALRRVRLARAGRPHERLRAALGPHARGHRVAAPEGTQIVAAAAGTIIYAGWLGGYGNVTLIDHGNGVATAYGHQSAIFVTGGAVSQGQAIGAVGSTGNSTGPHLHFEVRINAAPVDPLGYL